MARAIWKGSIGFGLVSIPVSVVPAMHREELKFNMLRESDHSRINYKRVAEADGKEVPWSKIVKGYEYEKGKYVVLKDADFARVDIEATQTVDILAFVKLAEVDPLLFYKPYYLEPAKGGDKAYGLLRDVLCDSDKIAIAKVVIKTRQHLAAVKPRGRGLMLELMYFPGELVDASRFKAPSVKKSSKAELAMAEQLVQSMTEKWDPAAYEDEYKDALLELIEEKVESGGKTPAKASKPKARTSNVIDLTAMLQKSVEQASAGKRKSTKPARKAAKKSKPAARKTATKTGTTGKAGAARKKSAAASRKKAA